MIKSLAGISLLLFGISVILWMWLTVFESGLVGMSAPAERMLIFLLLIVPAGIGAVFGFMSLIRKEGRTGAAMVGIALNGLFALINGAILLFAG